jgi:hypothetical protein
MNDKLFLYLFFFFQAAHMNCLKEIIIIVSMIYVSSVFYRPRDKEKDGIFTLWIKKEIFYLWMIFLFLFFFYFFSKGEVDAIHEKFFIPESDHLTLLNVYNQWEKNQFVMIYLNIFLVYPLNSNIFLVLFFKKKFFFFFLKFFKGMVRP